MVDFVRQAGEPLFPDIFWNRPTMKRRAGRLLVVGGQKSEFNLVQSIYQAAEAAGIGEALAAMPDPLRKIVGDDGFARFLPATSSGSLGKAALGELLQLANDVDGVVIGANLTSNAETGILIESLVRESETRLVFTQEAIRVLKFNPELITGNPRALVVVTMNGLFELANNHHMPIAIRPNSGVVGKLEILQQLVAISRCTYLVFDGEIMVAAGGNISLTALQQPLHDHEGLVVGAAATFWLQQPAKPFEALTAAAYVLNQRGTSDTELARLVRGSITELEDH